MSQTTTRERIAALLEEIDDLCSELAVNEAHLYTELRTKFYNQKTPYQPGFEDETCLQVILRNVNIRKKLREN